ncbi:MAG: 3-dehydroquinate synthase [Arenimonas sp.]
MPELHVELAARRYPIHIESGLLRRRIAALAQAPERMLIVTDDNVGPLYADALKQAIGRPDCPVWRMPAGEAEKNLARFGELLERMAERGLTRDARVLALGGGVIGDLAGFAASCYMRGIAFVQIPTTLLAMVDSSVGGKTAVDLPAGKNLVGAFHQPQAVYIDPDVLATLPEREFRAGLAEVLKYGAIVDARFVDWLEDNAEALLAREPAALEGAILLSCRHKAGIVARDETEQGERALLNFGHTFGHALEVLLDYGNLLHGEAVAIGMQLAADFSVELGCADIGDSQRLRALLTRFGLPTGLPAGLDAEAVVAKMRLDKKAAAGRLRLILWRGVGKAFIAEDVDAGALTAFLAGQTAGN